MLLGQVQQDRRGLRQPTAIYLQHRNLAHRVDGRPPFRRARDAAAKIRPYRLERLAAKRQHQRQPVAVT
jgi:hypothetical protein